MTRDSKTGALRPTHSVGELFENVPELKNVAEIELFDVANVDSTNIQPQNWLDLVRVIEENYEKFDGFVVTHGTDTMSFSASAVSFLIENLGKPVIFTGSQLPLTDTITDARTNLLHAFKFATGDLGEVAISFGAKLIRGNRAQKRSEFALEAFESVNVPPIGEFGLRPKLAEHRFRRDSTKTPKFHRKIEEKITVVHLHPGFNPKIIDAIVDTGVRGIVVSAFGAGNIPNCGKNSCIPAIQRAIAKGVVIVITTQCDLGVAEMLLYETGLEAHENASISAEDMTLEAAFTKLAVILTETGNPGQIRERMLANVAGELTKEG